MDAPISSLPFYGARIDERGRPAPWTLDDLEDFAAGSDDPFGGRMAPGARPPVALQIEATGEPPVWTGIDSRELGIWAGALAGIWKRWGLERGETIALFDYGSSPLVFLASASYVARLKRGAADRLGVGAICNDGVAAMAGRMMTILEAVAPSAIVIRRDLLLPFGDALRASGRALAPAVRWVAVTEPEGAPSRAVTDRAAAEWGLPVHRVLRADAAFFLSGECPDCGAFHVDPRRYRTEPLSSGEISLTTRFARLCPAVGYNLGRAERSGAKCAREPAAARIVWE